MKTDAELRHFDWLNRTGFVIQYHVTVSMTRRLPVRRPDFSRKTSDIEHRMNSEDIYFSHVEWLSKIAMFPNFGQLQADKRKNPRQ